jgi:hypothetical protein
MNDTPQPPEGSVPPPGAPTPPTPPTFVPPTGGTPSPAPGPAEGAYVPKPYPVDIAVEYQDRELNRTTTFFRLFTAIPILILLSTVTGTINSAGDWAHFVGVVGGMLVLPVFLMLIFEHKYPRWWFDFNYQLTSFIARVDVYLLLIDDRYPSTDEEQGVHIKIDYPDAQRDLSRFLPLIKWLLALPHYFILFFMWIGVIVGTIYAWFMVLFTGRYPTDIFEFVVGVMRWTLRVHAYSVLLVTDEYPPFRLES